jgi:hypothetical protein
MKVTKLLSDGAAPLLSSVVHAIELARECHRRCNSNCIPIFALLVFLVQSGTLMEELRREVGSWNLGSDKKVRAHRHCLFQRLQVFVWSLAQLLQYLQLLSSDITAKTKAVQNDLDDLYFESNAADLRLHNTFNQLLMLSNSQFIENVRERC